jgi:hypothetical protein
MTAKKSVKESGKAGSASGTKPAKSASKSSAPKSAAKSSAKASSKSSAKATKVEAHVDAPAPVSAKAAKAAKSAAAKAKAEKVVFQRDAPLPMETNAAQLLKELKKEQYDFQPAEGKGTFEEDKFSEFFDAEIEVEVSRPAEIMHDRIARWRCQCCDAIIPVPRRTTVYHGDYVLEHDDVMGLLVNGERWVPKAETPIEVQQPGRLRDPWTGELIRTGKRSV